MGVDTKCKNVHSTCLSCFWTQCSLCYCWVVYRLFPPFLPTVDRRVHSNDRCKQDASFLKQLGEVKNVGGVKNSRLGGFFNGFMPTLNLSAHTRMYAQLDSKT